MQGEIHMRSGLYYQYYVEGDDEKKLLEILKRDFRCIKSGKIDKYIRQLTHSTSTTDFKRDLISCSNLHTRLAKCGFDISKFWSRIPTNKFRFFGNNASFIKL